MYIIIVRVHHGSVKGTVGNMIAKRFRASTCFQQGTYLEEYIKEGNSLGEELKGYVNNGLLVPDELTIKIIYDRLQKTT